MQWEYSRLSYYSPGWNEVPNEAYVDYKVFGQPNERLFKVTKHLESYDEWLSSVKDQFAIYDDKFAALGAEAWELVSVQGGQAFFKRPIRPTG